jgi:TonB-dependent SusC/RagA subfamily outer membrane receptor
MISTLAPGDAASRRRRPPGVRAAAALLAIVALPLSLACHPGGEPRPRPEPRLVGDSGSVGNTDGRSMEDLFAGRFPGVSVTRADGGGLQLRIRGGSNTFYGSNEPLVVVDGTPLPPGTNGIVYLNPRDIQRIEVLKNPADTAIYGIRGGNGVIRITTTRPRPR